MEHKEIPGEKFPPFSKNYPWLVAQNLEAKDDSGDHIFYNVYNPKDHYRCHIPELVGRQIRASFHGWVILTNHPHDIEWSLWNPVTSKLICLPRLILKDGASDDILHCCLSSPPDDPGSILLLTRRTKRNFLFCRMDRERKKRKWIEISYCEQLRSIANVEDGLLLQPTCCNGKVYAYTGYTYASGFVILVNIVVNYKDQVVISLSQFASLPILHGVACKSQCTFLKGSCARLYAISVCFANLTKQKPVDVYLHELDMTKRWWDEIDDLQDTVFFVDTVCNQSVTCSRAITSEVGGYVHILHEMGKVIYSYSIKDKTIALSSIRCLDDLPARSRDSRTSHISIWAMPGFRSDSKQDEGKEDKTVVRSIVNDAVELNEPLEQNNKAHLLNIPFHVLEMMMEFCLGVEYLNFRATSKHCHLAAPVIQWSNEIARKRLQTYSLVSPWLVVFEIKGRIISFTDPMFGDKYFVKASRVPLFCDARILYSAHGWLLLYMASVLMAFFNPFTGDIRKLPPVFGLESACFSAPPTSPNYMVYVLSSYRHSLANIYFAGEPSWRTIILKFVGVVPHSFGFPTFYGENIYALFNEGELRVLHQNSWKIVVDEDPKGFPEEYYLVKCDQDLLKVIVGELIGDPVEVLKLNDSTKVWEKMEGLGRHMIYICDATCLCMEAKRPDMGNKIYFPALHYENGKMIFYSLDTCRYHTFNGGNVEENFRNFFGTKKPMYPHAWIEPSWS